jgi:hypothetical protein
MVGAVALVATLLATEGTAHADSGHELRAYGTFCASVLPNDSYQYVVVDPCGTDGNPPVMQWYFHPVPGASLYYQVENALGGCMYASMLGDRGVVHLGSCAADDPNNKVHWVMDGSTDMHLTMNGRYMTVPTLTADTSVVVENDIAPVDWAYEGF